MVTKNMYCLNCGSKIDGMNFCANCGTKIRFEFVDEKENPVKQSNSSSTKERKDLKIMGGILAFLPLLGLITMWIPDDIYSIISPAITGINIGLWYADKTILKKYGYTGKWTWWGIVFYPVYLYFRCKKINGKYLKLICNVASIALVLAIAFVPLNFNKKDYNEKYEWWKKYSMSTLHKEEGSEYIEWVATFKSKHPQNDNRYIQLSAFENRDGSYHLTFSCSGKTTWNILYVQSSNDVVFDKEAQLYYYTGEIYDIYKNGELYASGAVASDSIIIIFDPTKKELVVSSFLELSGYNEYPTVCSGTYAAIE